MGWAVVAVDVEGSAPATTSECFELLRDDARADQIALATFS